MDARPSTFERTAQYPLGQLRREIIAKFAELLFGSS